MCTSKSKSELESRPLDNLIKSRNFCRNMITTVQVVCGLQGSQHLIDEELEMIVRKILIRLHDRCEVGFHELGDQIPVKLGAE